RSRPRFRHQSRRTVVRALCSRFSMQSRFLKNSLRMSILQRRPNDVDLRSLGRFLSVFPGEMSVPNRDAIEGNGLAAASSRFRFWSEIKFNRLPGIAPLRLQPEARGRLVAAVDHAILATRIARDTIDDSVFFPLHFFEQLGIARVMRVGH